MSNMHESLRKSQSLSQSESIMVAFNNQLMQIKVCNLSLDWLLLRLFKDNELTLKIIHCRMKLEGDTEH